MANITEATQIDDYIPSIDLGGYFEPTSPTSKDEVIAKVRAACLEHGFFQIVGHGVPVDIQRRMLACCKTFFDMPKEEKTALSLRKFSWRRGYEYNEQKSSEDVLPDMKEVSEIRISSANSLCQAGFLCRAGVAHREDRLFQRTERLARPCRKRIPSACVGVLRAYVGPWQKGLGGAPRQFRTSTRHLGQIYEGDCHVRSAARTRLV